MKPMKPGFPVARSLGKSLASNHTPAAIRPVPARGAIRRPKGVTFSRRMSNASRTIQIRFMTPPTSNSAINAQQQPTQYAPWRSPSINAPGASGRKPPLLIRNANGVWHWVRHTSLSRVH